MVSTLSLMPPKLIAATFLPSGSCPLSANILQKASNASGLYTYPPYKGVPLLW